MYLFWILFLPCDMCIMYMYSRYVRRSLGALSGRFYRHSHRRSLMFVINKHKGLTVTV